MNQSSKALEPHSAIQEENESVVFHTDTEGYITAVNGGWQKFASENQGEDVAGDLVLGTSMWECLSDISLYAIYQSLFECAKAGQPVCFSYRCDAPDCRRWWTMTIRRLEKDHMKFESKLVREERRPTVSWLERDGQRSEWFILVCSWCQLVAAESGEWLTVEDAVETMGLLQSDKSPQLTHGICPSCNRIVRAQIDELNSTERGFAANI